MRSLGLPSSICLFGPLFPFLQNQSSPRCFHPRSNCRHPTLREAGGYLLSVRVWAMEPMMGRLLGNFCVGREGQG